MFYTYRMTEHDRQAYCRNWGWLIVWGILLLILGLIALSATAFTTLISIFVLGILLLTSGIIMVIDAFIAWWRQWYGFFLFLIMGFLSFVVGFLLIQYPVMASMSLTWLLGFFYLMLGIFRLTYAVVIQAPQWGWWLFSGIVAFLLGLLILMSWPAASLFIIGLFVGIDLIFWGWAAIMAGLYARTLRQIS